MTDKRKPIGQMLLERGIINEDQLKTALDRQKRWGKRLGENLVSLDFITEQQLAKVLGEIYRMPTVDVRTAPFSAEAVKMVPEDFCRKHHLIPIALKVIEGKEQLVVAFSDPSDVAAIDELRFLVKYPVFEVLSTAADIMGAIVKQYQGGDDAAFQLVREVTLTRIQEDVAPEIFYEELPRPVKSAGAREAAKSLQRWEIAFRALVQLLVDKELIGEDEGQRLRKL